MPWGGTITHNDSRLRAFSVSNRTRAKASLNMHTYPKVGILEYLKSPNIIGWSLFPLAPKINSAVKKKTSQEHRIYFMSPQTHTSTDLDKTVKFSLSFAYRWLTVRLVRICLFFFFLFLPSMLLIWNWTPEAVTAFIIKMQTYQSQLLITQIKSFQGWLAATSRPPPPFFILAPCPSSFQEDDLPFMWNLPPFA